MARKSRSSKSDSGWLDQLPSATKDHWATQAEVAAWDLLPQVALIHALRVFAAVMLPMLFLLLTFANTAPLLAAHPAMIGVLALVVYGATLFQGKVAGLPSLPTLHVCLAGPFWTATRAPVGSKTWFLWRSVVVNVMYAGLILLASYAAQLAAVKLSPGLNFTIPEQNGPMYVPTYVNGTQTGGSVQYLNDAQYTLYGTTIALLASMMCVLTWYNVLGVGDTDGAWVRWSSAIHNHADEKEDRYTMATVVAMSTLVVYAVTGVPLVPTPEYVFATWSQNTTLAGTDYALLFAWTIGAAAMTHAVNMLMTSFASGLAGSLFEGVYKGSGSRKKRFYMAKEKKRDDDEPEPSTDEDSDGGD